KRLAAVFCFVAEQQVQRSLRLCCRNTRLQPAHNGKPPGACIFKFGRPAWKQTRSNRERHPYIRPTRGHKPLEILFCYPDDGEWQIVEAHCLADGGTGTAKRALP